MRTIGQCRSKISLLVAKSLNFLGGRIVWEERKKEVMIPSKIQNKINYYNRESFTSKIGNLEKIIIIIFSVYDCNKFIFYHRI